MRDVYLRCMAVLAQLVNVMVEVCDQSVRTDRKLADLMTTSNM